ncbi:PorV/PorQ family protein [candidate division KSB1 bacterium]|nr:PorV/PorQ family protein [candidate division KSB1 bacterium]
MQKYRSYKIIITFMVSLFSFSSALSQDKLAQTGMQFLSVGTDARAVAMGEAFTTIEGRSSSLFYNPACMARTSNTFDISLNQNNWIAGIKHNSGTMSLNLANGRYGVFGISFLSVDYGDDIYGTIVDPDPSNPKGYLPTDPITPSAYMIGLGYAIQLSDRFSVGGQIKNVHQNLGASTIPVDVIRPDPEQTTEVKNSLSTVSFDFGTFYQTGFNNLVFGMSVRNYSPEVKYVREGFQLPLTFKFGFSVDAFELLNQNTSMHSLHISIDAVHPRSYPEFLNIGGEYLFMNAFSLRAGYITNQEEYSYTAGFGLQKFGIALDYAYTPFNAFEDVSRLSVRFSF